MTATAAPTTGVAPRLSDRQQTVLDALAALVHERGRPPTYAELCERTGIPSRGHMHYVLSDLEEKGYIERRYGEVRGIRLTGIGVPRPTCPHCGQEVA